MDEGRDRAGSGSSARAATAEPEVVPVARAAESSVAESSVAESPVAESTVAGSTQTGPPRAGSSEHAPRATASEPEGAPDPAVEPAGSSPPGSSEPGSADGEGTTRLAVEPPRGRGSTRPGLDGPTTHLPNTRGGARPEAGPNGRPAPPAGAGHPPWRGPVPRSGQPPHRPHPGPVPGGDGPLPGAMLVDRYRLVAEVGRDRRAGAALWKARDVMLERDVAVTLLTGGWQADARASSALSRATRSAHFEHAHAARVLDVVQPGSGRLPPGIVGAAVAEWTPGRDLAELVADGPLRPSAALRVVEPLAAAVADAHRSGLVLGLDHPQRVRVSPRGSARLAFPMPPGDADVDDDVHGLGAALYLLLTARWPAEDGQAPAGLRAAPRLASGAPVPARQLRPDLPVELAALVDRTLDADGGIRTAAAVHGLATQLRERLDDDGVLLPLTEDGAPLGEDSSAVWLDDDEAQVDRDPSTRRKLRIGVALLVLATLAIVAVAAFQLVSLVRGGGSSAPPLVIPTSPTAASAPPAAARAGGPVPLASVAVYDPSGSPDNPARVTRAVDGDPSSTWTTVQYRQQLPAAKPGIGIMTTFGAPSAVSAVTVRSPSPGTRIEIRSAPAANVPLSQTQLLGVGTVTGDQLVIPLRPAPPTQNLLVWITGLSRDGGSYSSELAEVAVQRAG